MGSTLFASTRVPRAVWHTIGLILVAFLAYLIWRGYQSPDFLIDFSALRICGVSLSAEAPRSGDATGDRSNRESTLEVDTRRTHRTVGTTRPRTLEADTQRFARA